MRLIDSRLKIDRARKHIEDINNRIAALPDAYVASVEINPAGGNKVIKHDLSDRNAAADIALMVGDAIHNLKCALDYAWVQTIERVAPSLVSNFAKFPVYPSLDELKSTLIGRKVDALSPVLFDLIISEIKPYNGGDIAIWPVHRLNIRDKHRLLIPLVSFASVEDIQLENEIGKITVASTWASVQPPPYYIPIEDGWHIKKKGKISVSVLFDEAVFGREFRTVDSLNFFSATILKVVESLENVY